jgi:PIN domain nuclease of toxin-antitoxin system
MLVAKRRLVFDRDVEIWMDLALKLPGVQLVPLSPRIAVRSSRFEGDSLGDPADRILVATAMDVGCTIVTKDEKIRRYPQVRSIW